MAPIVIDAPLKSPNRDWSIAGSRRALIASGLLLGAAAGLSDRHGALAQLATSAATPTGAGGWSFTDDHGKTVTLPARPIRIVAQVELAAAMWDYGVRPAGIFGIVSENGERDPAAGNIDELLVTSVGEQYNDIDLEALAALQPDLIVSTFYVADDPDSFWWVKSDMVPLLNEIAPTLAIRGVDTTLAAMLHRIADLARALGADVTAPDVAAAWREFDAASARLHELAASKPGMSILAVSPTPDSVFVANYAEALDLSWYHEQGLEFVVPDGATDFWQELSWEEFGRYPADVILQDWRAGHMSDDELARIPTWSMHPAVLADQIAPWTIQYPLNPGALAGFIDDLTVALTPMRGDIV